MTSRVFAAPKAPGILVAAAAGRLQRRKTSGAPRGALEAGHIRDRYAAVLLVRRDGAFHSGSGAARHANSKQRMPFHMSEAEALAVTLPFANPIEEEFGRRADTQRWARTAPVLTSVVLQAENAFDLVQLASSLIRQKQFEYCKYTVHVKSKISNLKFSYIYFFILQRFRSYKKLQKNYKLWYKGCIS